MLDGLGEGVEVGLVEADDGTGCGDPHVRVRLEELLTVGIESETVNAVTHRQDEDGGGGVEAVT